MSVECEKKNLGFVDRGMTVGGVLRTLKFIWNHPANHRNRLRALSKAVAWQAYKRFTRQPFDIELARGLRFRCHPDSVSASLMLYCAGVPDYHEMMFMRRYLRPGDGFIDVGANVGVYTLYAASLVGREAAIESFEPGLKAAVRLRENLALNQLKNVRVHDTAVGAYPSIVRLTADEDTLNRIEPDPNVGSTVEVKCVRLDDVLQSERYAMGKMDIEGAEPLAFRGAERVLREENPPVWLIEMNGELHRYGFIEEDLKDWLAERGYELALYDADRSRFAFPGRPWELSANVLAVHRGHWKSILNRVQAGLDRAPTAVLAGREAQGP